MPLYKVGESRSAWPAAFVTTREITPQLLGPARFSLEALQRMAKDEALSTHMAAGQYQQRPTAREGGLFKRAWFTRCHERDGSGQAPCRDALDLRPGLVQTLSWRDAFLVLPICPITLSTASAATKQLFGGESARS